MSKALEEIKTLRGFNKVELNNDENINKSLDIIEQALQRLEAIEKGKVTDIIDNYMAFKNDNVNHSEALEELKELHELAYGNEETSWKIDEIRMSSHIKQALIKSQEQEKVLKIIFEKNVDSYILKTCLNLEHYNSEIRRKNKNNTYSYEIWYELTQEEFELLKRYCDEQNN